MSLLMKALEKAAKDRDEARAEPVATAPGGPSSEPETLPGHLTAPESAPAVAPGPRSELSLEPIALPTETAASPPPARPETPSRPAVAARAGRGARGQREQQARAATVVQAAGAAASSGAIAWLMARPVVIFGIIAVLFGIGYGTYVYLQLFHPALFLPKPPTAPKGPPPSSPIGQAPPPTTGTVPAVGPAGAAGPDTVAGAAPGTTQAGPAAPATPAPSTPTTSVLAPSAAKTAVPDFTPPAAPAPKRAPEKAAAEALPSLPPPAPPRDAIVVSRGSTTAPTVSPLLNDAYTALRADRRADAQRAYEQLVRTEPRNTDALLGLASIATTEGRSDEATRRYLQILELDPRNTLAQSGLIALLGRADPLAAESRLNQLIAREPSAYLHFTLGNLYADQSQWSAAQHAYFQAHHLEPSNPDYAYNLAVGLEHVGQPKLALGFYRRAVDLAGATGLARFDVAQAQQRIGRLASQVE
jgi:Flp pilus assembly protein TadD